MSTRWTGQEKHLGRNTIVATHESLTLRILFDHEAEARDTSWAVAAYETPVSEHMWHMTITPATPPPGPRPPS
ncbi:hypothetical protein AB0D71_46840 [Streptomyces avermitilis]|uniref:hypothetical protein n=1 Tax=Streptomyces avermitilis TaxID=33903 RepID=UPI0033F62A4B